MEQYPRQPDQQEDTKKYFRSARKVGKLAVMSWIPGQHSDALNPKKAAGIISRQLPSREITKTSTKEKVNSKMDEHLVSLIHDTMTKEQAQDLIEGYNQGSLRSVRRTISETHSFLIGKIRNDTNPAEAREYITRLDNLPIISRTIIRLIKLSEARRTRNGLLSSGSH